MTLLLLLVCVLCVCSSEGGLRVYTPGDIIIGGLFPLHLQTDRSKPNSANCTDYSLKIFLRSQVMIYAINKINQDPDRRLPNLTLGYDLYDTCGDVWFAIRAALNLLKGQSESQSCFLPANVRAALPESPIKAVIGESYSEVSIAVARILSLSSVAQISPSSTSELLSKKSKFPTFLRTVPSDVAQTKAISELVRRFDWRSVAIVGSDDEYGKYGSDRLRENFNTISVCVDFVHILPGNFALNNSETSEILSELMEKIQNSPAEAIILFTKGSNVKFIMEGAIKRHLNRTWIGGDSWSTSTKIHSMKDIQRVGQIFGFIPNQKDVPGFKDYVSKAMFNTTNEFIRHYNKTYPPCPRPSEEKDEGYCSLTKECLDPGCLVKHVEEAGFYYTYLAVNVVVEALRCLLKCDSQKCERGNNFTAAELLTEIKRINITVNSTPVWFDANGDPSIGYDILQWNLTGPEHSKKVIGYYWPSGRMQLPEDLVSKMSNRTVTAFNCSIKCEPGQGLEKKLERRCCKECVRCEGGEWSPGGEAVCQHCHAYQYSTEKKDKCHNKTDEFLKWTDPFMIILTSFDVLGIIATVVFLVLFTIHRSTPVVKAVGGYLCFLELLSLLACFCLVFTFIGEPTHASCLIGIPCSCLAFTICISCILANLFQIMLGFNFDQGQRRWLKKLNHPVAVVAVTFGLQLALFIPWLVLYRPYKKSKPKLESILLHCEKGSDELFVAMLAYNALLAFVCFLFAFKGKRLPDLYKNASLITVSMVLFLVLWIAFIPIHIFKTKNTPKIEAAAILISSYSILCCHLAPKCYIMVFRKEINNENAITEHIKQHYERKGMAVVK